MKKFIAGFILLALAGCGQSYPKSTQLLQETWDRNTELQQTFFCQAWFNPDIKDDYLNTLVESGNIDPKEAIEFYEYQCSYFENYWEK